MIKKIIALLILAGVGYGIYYFVNQYLEDKDAWKVEIISETIVVRDEPDATSFNPGGKKVYLGEIHNVIEIYEDDLKFVWYKIEYDKDKIGWIASAREVPYVKEINNPHREEGESVEYEVIDYKRPILSVEDTLYQTYDINTINYDHITVEEDSDYEIVHEVYFEEFPKDSNVPQYWIQYIVTDVHGNFKEFVQKIEFEVKPSQDDVKLFEELNR